jgi:hypothetical protein
MQAPFDENWFATLDAAHTAWTPAAPADAVARLRGTDRATSRAERTQDWGEAPDSLGLSIADLDRGRHARSGVSVHTLVHCGLAIDGQRAGVTGGIGAANHLLSRWLPAPGVIQAWGSLDNPQQRGRTIIDSLMNLPLLYWASEETGEGRFASAATRHAEQVMNYLVLADGSTCHTLYFDADSGAPRFGRTHH